MTQEGPQRSPAQTGPPEPSQSLLGHPPGGATAGPAAESSPSLPVGRTVPEGGWGWMVVAGSLLCQVMYALTVRVFGVTYLGLLDRYNDTATATSWVGGISIAASGLFSPVATELLPWVSARWLTIGATVIVASSLLATGFMARLEYTYLTYGLLTGFGTSITVTCGFVMVAEYFERRRAMAMGIINIGSSVGALLFSPVLVYWYDTYGYTGTFVLISAISLHTFISGMTFRGVKSRPTSQTSSQRPDNISNPKTLGDSHERSPETGYHSSSNMEDYESCQQQQQQQYHQDPECSTPNNQTTVIKPEQSQTNMGFFRRYLNIVSDIKFVAFLQLIFVFAFLLSVASAFLPSLAIEKGAGAFQGATLLSIAAVSNIIASPVTGWVFDTAFVQRRRHLLYGLSQAVAGITSLLCPVSPGYVGLLGLSFIYGFAASVVMSQRMTMVGDILGRRRMRDGVAMTSVVFSIGGLFGRIIAGVMKDQLGVYGAGFYLGGAITVVSALIFTLALRSLADK